MTLVLMKAAGQQMKQGFKPKKQVGGNRYPTKLSTSGCMRLGMNSYGRDDCVALQAIHVETSQMLKCIINHSTLPSS